MTKLLITVEEGLTGKVTLRRDAAGNIVCDNAHVTIEAVARESRREPSTPAKGPKAVDAEKPEKPEKPRKAKPKAGSKRATSLVWKPTTDAGFTGFVARTEGGRFKLLHSKTSQWALLLERPDKSPEVLGCFPKEQAGKVEAQRLHDLPKARARPVSEVMLQACPLPPGSDGGEAAPTNKTPARKVPASDAPASDAPPADAGTDQTLINSLKATLKELDDDVE